MDILDIHDINIKIQMLRRILVAIWIFGIAYFIVYTFFRKFCCRRNAVPGPRAWPFFGNLLGFVWTKQLHLKADEYHRRYGPVTGLQMSIYPAVILSDWRIIKEVLVNKADEFCRDTQKMSNLTLANGRGILFSDGEIWKLHKKLILTSMKEFGAGPGSLEYKVQEEIEAVIHEIKAAVGQEQYNFQHIFNMATANVIYAVLFGKRYEYTDTEFVDILTSINTVMKQSGHRNIFEHLPPFMAGLCPIVTPSIFKIAIRYRQFVQHMTRKIEEHRSTFDPSVKRSLIDYLLSADVTLGEMVQTATQLVVAGSETTSTTLLWAFIFMVKNVGIQEKCRQEILEVVGNYRPPAMTDRNSMPYTRATIMEVQRLGSVVAVSPLLYKTKRSTQLHGYSIRENTMIFLNLYTVLRDPQNWEQPQEFRPERFLSEDKRTTIKPDAFIPFSMGRRSCPGENLANMELFLMFTSILQKFKFTAVDPENLPSAENSTFGATLIPDQYFVKVEAI